MSTKPTIPGLYQGNQVIINSDRLLFNAKEDSILLFSNKAIGFSTRGSIHFDTSYNKTITIKSSQFFTIDNYNEDIYWI